MKSRDTENYGVKRIGLFGSYVSGSAHSSSDIDLLVELERLTFNDYMGLTHFLEDLFNKKVDLVTHKSLKPRLKPYVENEVEYVTKYNIQHTIMCGKETHLPNLRESSIYD